MSCKFILEVGNKIMSCKLIFASCELFLMSCKFKEIIFQVASCVFWIENFILRLLRVESLRR